MEELKDFSFACRVSDLKESEGKRFYINDTDLAIFKLNKKVYALSNVCPHQQATKIYEGFIEDGCIVCPLHGWAFKLETGKLKSGSRGLNTFQVKIVNEKVYVKVKAKKFNW